MSLWRRLERALGTFATVELDDGSRFGANGEDDAGRILAGVGEHVTRNPVVPHPRKPGAYLEGDFLIYAHGRSASLVPAARSSARCSRTSFWTRR